MTPSGARTPAIVDFPRQVPRSLSLDGIIEIADKIAIDHLSDALTTYFLEAAVASDRTTRSNLFLLVAAIAARLGEV